MCLFCSISIESAPTQRRQFFVVVFSSYDKNAITNTSFFFLNAKHIQTKKHNIHKRHSRKRFSVFRLALARFFLLNSHNWSMLLFKVNIFMSYESKDEWVSEWVGLSIRMASIGIRNVSMFFFCWSAMFCVCVTRKTAQSFILHSVCYSQTRSFFFSLVIEWMLSIIHSANAPHTHTHTRSISVSF